MHPLRSLVLIATAASLVVAMPPPAGAQKLARKYFEDERNGFRFKPLDGFALVPPQPQEEAQGMICKMGKELVVRRSGGESWRIDAECIVLRFVEKTVRGEKKEGGKGEDDRSVSETHVRDDLAAYLGSKYNGVDKDEPTLDEEVKVKKLAARHRRWQGRTSGSGIDLLFDTWTFPLEDADVHLVFILPSEFEKKWARTFTKSAKTFGPIERKGGASEITKGASYGELLKFHREDAARIPGWRALPTPSEKYIVKTSNDNKRFIKQVISRLEKSRELYERDFPPSKDFDHVSIVRICSNQEEFHKYGNTGGGVAGWFNPGTTELVLYDSHNVDPNMTFAVMSHEAFHQYCHFLFEQSEAHRWFDEGHGDYYGGVEFKGSKAVITPKMPAGLNRLSVIKEMVRQEEYVPIEDHIHFSHREWQTQGPSNVSCYSQSWSIIYMLRQGTLGKVSRKVWKQEYADILPSYVTTLHAGFREAYDEIRAQRKKGAAGEDDVVNRFDLPPGKKDEIWKRAMEASWGQIDVEEFERNWIKFVEDYL